MVTLTDRQVIDVFIKLVDELGQSKYLQQARSGGVGSAIVFSPAIRGPMLARSNPDRDYLKAALLTVRLFGQNNEPVSLHNMDALLQRLPIDPALKSRFTAARTEFNNHLGNSPGFGLATTIPATTCGEIFQTFLYGEFAHLHADKMRTIDGWKTQPYFNALRSQFDLTLQLFISAVARIRQVLIEAIAAGSI